MQNSIMWNLVESMACMARVPGWSVLMDDGLIALQTPAKRPFCNLVWGEVSRRNLASAERYFDGKPYSWLLTEGQDAGRLLDKGFYRIDPSPEMALDLSGTRSRELPAGLTIERVTGGEPLRAWAEVLGESFATPTDEMLDFFQPLLGTEEHVAFLGRHQGRPAATAMVFLGSTGAGLFAISTREGFRRQGLGLAMVGRCLEVAREAGLPTARLYTTTMAQELYEKAGFVTGRVLDEYCSANYPH